MPTIQKYAEWVLEAKVFVDDVEWFRGAPDVNMPVVDKRLTSCVLKIF